MEEHQRTNGNGEAALYEDVLDEDEARLIIDEGCLFSEDKNEKCKFERKTRFSKSKSRKDIQEMANTYPCPDCGKTFRRKAKLEAHFLTHKSKDELECENCKRKFRKVDTLFNHVCSGFGNSYKCSECDEWFRLKRDLVVHQQSHKQTPSDEQPDEKNPTEVDFSSFVASFVKWPVICTQCGAELVNLQHYNAHMAAHKKGGPSYFCLMCKTKFSCKDDYLLHKDLCHIEGIFECTFCCKRFHTEKRLSDHLESHSGEGVGCEVCGLRFVNKEKLSSHMKIHSSTSIFVCAKCKKIFRCNSSLKNHNCAPENSKKKLYTFDDRTEKIMNEQFQDSLSAIEDSDSEDAELCEFLSESHPCKVCGDSFQQKEDLISHLTDHFQCGECKKYFKSQTDLDMHNFLLADEKLFSCCLCEAVVHGKKELEGHISSHLTAEEDLLDDLEWEDNTEVLQNITLSLDSNEPFHSTSLERSLSSVKIHKVTPAGRNALKCLSCGKFVFSYHNLSAHIESSTPTGDSDEEYVYISRLGSPQVKLKPKEDAYCSCHHSSATGLASLSEQSTNLSISSSECGDQESLKILTTTQIPTHLHTLKHMVNEPIDNKSKSFLNQATETRFVALDANSKKDDTFDKSEEALKFEKEDCRVTMNSVNSTELLEKSLSSSSVSSITATPAKRDCDNVSENSKASLVNVDLENRKEVNSPKKLGIRVIKLDSSKVDSPSSRSSTKELFVNNNLGKDSLPAPVRIFVTTSGLLSVSANNEGKELSSGSELPANQKPPKSSPVNNKTNFRKILPKVNIVSLEDLVLPPPKRKGIDQDSQDSTPSPPKKIKIEAPVKRLPPSNVTDVTKVEIVPSKQNTNTVKTSDCEKITFENESLNANNDKSRHVGQQSLPKAGGITEPVVGKPRRKSRTSDKAEPAVLTKDKSTRSFNGRTHFKKREHQGKNKKRRDTSNLNVNGNDSCHLPDTNMIFKVEKLNYDSEEDDEDDSLDFSGIKKEFLASDVFIKEEWDIVDF